MIILFYVSSIPMTILLKYFGANFNLQVIFYQEHNLKTVAKLKNNAVLYVLRINLGLNFHKESPENYQNSPAYCY